MRMRALHCARMQHLCYHTHAHALSTLLGIYMWLHTQLLHLQRAVQARVHTHLRAGLRVQSAVLHNRHNTLQQMTASLSCSK